MTYIKWKDEVESYLVNVPTAEKQKIFSYFSEMYADKRDAGKSEAQIVEEFGAPYDVAKRILEGCKDSSPSPSASAASDGGADKQAGGNNYNYNYYNYNYGAPAQPPSEQPVYSQPTYTQPAYTPPPAEESAQEEPSRPDPYKDGIPVEVLKPQKEKKKRGVVHVLLSILMVLLLIAFCVTLIGGAVCTIVEGFATCGVAIGGLVSSAYAVGEGLAVLGEGLTVAGVGFILLAPFSALCVFISRQVKKFVKGE